MLAVAELYMHSQNMLSFRMVFKECHIWEVLPCSEPTYLYQTCQQYTGKEMSLPFREDTGMNCVQKFVRLDCITRVSWLLAYVH